MHKSEGNECCKDEVKIFKIQDDQQTSAISFKFTSPDAVVAELSLWNETFLVTSTHHFITNTFPSIK